MSSAVQAQTVLAPSSTQVNLAGFPTGNPFTVNSGTTISGSSGVAMIFGSNIQAWTLNTNGIITNTLSGSGNGIQFDNGGSINNAATNTAARIAGFDKGILIQGGSGSVVNAGTINGGSLSSGSAIRLLAGGSLTNNATGTVATTAGGTTSVFIDGAPGTVDNFGLISGMASGTGVSVNAGGSVINRLGATITAGGSTISGIGVIMNGPLGTVSVENFGTIAGATGTFGGGVTIVFGGTVINHSTGVMSGGDHGVHFNATPDAGSTLINDGRIMGTSPAAPGVGVRLSNGTVTNGATDPTASITGVLNGVVYDIAGGTHSVINSGSITATGSGIANLAGIRMRNGGTVTNNAGGTITASGTGAAGIKIEGDTGTVDNTGSVTGGQAGTGNAGVWLTFGGSVTNRPGGAIDSGTVGVRIDARPGTVTNAGTIASTVLAGGTGVLLSLGGTVTNQVGGAIQASATGVTGGAGLTVDSSGLIAGGTVSVPATAVLFSSGANTLSLRANSTTIGNVQMGSGTDSTTVFGGANIAGVPLFHGGTGTSNLTFDGYAGAARAVSAWQQVLVTNGANVSFDGADTHQAQLFQVDSGATLGFSSQAGTLTGNVNNAGTLNYTVGNGAATYAITGILTNSGLVGLNGTAGIAGNTLTVANYVGQGGRMAFNTFLGDDASPSDKLIINGGAGSGNTALLISNTTGGGALTVADGILVVDAQNGATTTTDAFSLGNRVAAGAYEYGLFRGGVSNANSWFLRSTLLPPPPPPPPGPPPPPPPPNYRPEVPTDMVLPVLANRLGLNMIGTYRDRFGEDYPDPAAPAEPVFCKDPAQNYRCTPTAEQAGVYAGATPRKMAAWGRIFGETGERDFGSDDLVGSLNGFLDNGPSYDIHVWGLQAGMDLWRKQHEDGSRDIGGFYLSYGRATADVNGVYGGDAGSAEMNAYALGGYWTHIGAPGWYVDAVLQGTRYDQADTTSVLGESFDTEGWGIAASLEGGYPFVLGQGWTIEPQAQLVYQHVTLDDGADSFGLIGFDDSDALYGRLGGRLARNWMTENNRHMTAWLSANVWSSFGADATTTFAGLSGANIVALDADLGGTWGSFGLGLSAEVADNVRLFASGDYNIGFDDGDSWSVGGRVGLKVVW